MWEGASGAQSESSLRCGFPSLIVMEMDLDELDERMFGGEANAGVSFQISQLRYVLLHDEYIPVRTKYIPGTYWI